MPAIVACIDGSLYSPSVADHAAWAAGRLGGAVELLQVLGRREVGPADLSGSLEADASAHLLDELATLDAQRARLAQKRARLVMDEVRARILGQGVGEVAISLRQGDLLEAIAEREAGAELIVVGKRGEAADFAKLHLGSNLERIARASQRPVLVASRAFKPINRALIAFDGGASTLEAVDYISRSPLFAGLEIHLVMVGADEPALRKRLDAVAGRLAGAGLRVETHVRAGTPDRAIAEAVGGLGADLLVMGAYSHTRLRTLFIGSTTTEMIRSCLVPVMLFR
jgi:nucleotide-binding universal stress UspA family protein